jgi:2,4-dienoyl-CoA reductase-like NADH-dependent reductase (Old Yellow Enzyme family)
MLADMQADLAKDPVLSEVEAFLQSSGMTATAFGQKALNDPTLVHELRRGRDLRRSTRARILAFIAAPAEERAA